ncbi:MAG: hypothetical protein AAB933_00575 [Patescibacteria group bacterium]
MKKFIKNKMPDRALDSQIESKALSGGYTILELLFYIAFFTTFSLLVINAIIMMTKSFKETSIYGELAQGGVIMERIAREIRQAENINSIGANDLILNTKGFIDSEKTVEFKFVSPNIQFWDAGSNIGNLNSPNIAITGLAFTEIITAKGKAVKVVLSIYSNNDSLARVQNFYDTIVLRGGY